MIWYSVKLLVSALIIVLISEVSKKLPLIGSLVASIPLISVQDDSVCGNDSIFFINNSINSSFFWEFGDGSSSFLSNPIHSYDSSGIYDVIISLTSLFMGFW